MHRVVQLPGAMGDKQEFRTLFHLCKGSRTSALPTCVLPPFHMFSNVSDRYRFILESLLPISCFASVLKKAGVYRCYGGHPQVVINLERSSFQCQRKYRSLAVNSSIIISVVKQSYESGHLVPGWRDLFDMPGSWTHQILQQEILLLSDHYDCRSFMLAVCWEDGVMHCPYYCSASDLDPARLPGTRTQYC
jgi:hypothetical protein